MKGCKLTLFLFIIWWSIVSASIDHISSLELQATHQENTFKENDLNADEHIVNMTSDNVNYSHDFFYRDDLKKICHGQVNEFVWKCPTISENKEKILTFRTVELIAGKNDSSLFSTWYLKSVNEIDIFEMHPRSYMHQIQFNVKIDTQTIILTALYPTYPEISGFEILQFISHLAFQCKFSIEVCDRSDISKVYSALYDQSYYKYHFKGVDLSQKFLFKNCCQKENIFRLF
jgi:hypothetical protein